MAAGFCAPAVATRQNDARTKIDLTGPLGDSRWVKVSWRPKNVNDVGTTRLILELGKDRVKMLLKTRQERQGARRRRLNWSAPDVPNV